MKTLTLKKPVTVAEKTTTELHFREEICAGDMRGILIREEMSWDDFMKIGGRLCGQTDPVMNKLSLEDAQAVMTLVAGFFTPSQETGTKPSP